MTHDDEIAPSEALRGCISRCAAIRLLIDAGRQDAVQDELARLRRTLDWVGDMFHGVSTIEGDLHRAQRECVSCVRLLAYPTAAELSLVTIERVVAVVLGRIGG